jgi:hypothetical protein
LSFRVPQKKLLFLRHLLSIINGFIKVLANNDPVCKIKVVEFIMITSSKSPLSKRPRVDKGKLSPSYKALHPVYTPSFIGFGAAQG